MVTASYGHYGQRAVRIGPDRICRIRLPASDSVSFFQRKPGSYCAKPTRIRSGWPGQVLGKRILSGSKPVCRNHWARCWQNATSPLPVSHFQIRLRPSTDGPDHIVQSQPGFVWVLADYVRSFAERIRSRSRRCILKL